MQIKYVVSTMVFRGQENPLSLEQECELLKSLGFGIELLPNIYGRYDCRYEKRNWSLLEEATKNMLVSIRSRDDNPTLQQWSEQIECARLLNANIVTDLKSIGLPENAHLNGCNFTSEVINMADKNGITVCLETGQLHILIEAADRFQSIQFCLDTGYVNLNGEYSFYDYVDKLAPRVKHLHLADNYKQTDDHVLPGLNGGMPREKWDYLLDALNKYDHEVIGSIEMCPFKPEIMIKHASDFLFDKLNWPNRPQIQWC